VPPSVQGIAAVGAALNVKHGSWTGVSQWDVAWQLCNKVGKECSVIPGAGQSSYTPRTADAGRRVRVIVTGRGNGQEEASSQPSAVIMAAAKPENTVEPEVKGIVALGSQISGTLGEWSGSPDMTFEYGWKRCSAAGRECMPIQSKGLGNSYTVRW